jgi:hypothetical protein
MFNMSKSFSAVTKVTDEDINLDEDSHVWKVIISGQ